MADEHVQRSLGRIEGTLAQVLAKLDRLGDDLGDHKNEDQKNFSAIRALFFEKLDQHSKDREEHLVEQDKKLDALKQDADRAKGAGWVILALLGSFAGFVGAAAIAVIKGWISFKFH